MNMFRNIITVVVLGLAIALWFVPLEDWRWVGSIFGGDAILYVQVLLTAQPFSSIVLAVIAIALFMTRKQY